ncbi:BOS complex subunit NCLN [Rhynchophorus ferrugineus]|uniref:BOS complex subunit NCLN n=1 Tax=Rhynchophorus ferrugineus TaxID=354439 RepID=UPI003FCD3CF2
MWINEVDEIFKAYLPYYVLVFLPIFIIVSPTSPVTASYEFPAYRMQHYDLHGTSYGSRAASVNLEARALSTWSSSRHCLVTRLKDLSIDTFRNIKGKVGALVIVLPASYTNLTRDEKQQMLLLENKMLFEEETTIPVYFVKHSKEMNNVVDDLSKSVDINDKRKSAGENLYASVAANGYQITISTGTPSIRSDNKIATIHGHLAGYRSDGKVPTIVLVTHYDSFGVAPDLSYGVDSNGSGVIIMLELIRTLSTLYADTKTRGKFNLVFLLSGGGKFNFQGSKKWLEDQLDATETTLLQEASFVTCLDTLVTSDTIFMHVSKPPKEGSPAAVFHKYLKTAAEQYASVSVEGVHKKINLAEDLLAWEHERYSIRRLPAFTLSSIKSHKDPWKSTILDNRENLKYERLITNAKVIVEALGKYILNVTEGDAFNGSLDINKANLDNWLRILSSQPRSAQLLNTKDATLVTQIQSYLSKHLSDVKITYAIPDKRDPDYQFYSITKGTMNIYRVKPAVFDLILTLAIITYLTLVYYTIHYVPALYSVCSNLMKNKKVRSS